MAIRSSPTYLILTAAIWRGEYGALWLYQRSAGGSDQPERGDGPVAWPPQRVIHEPSPLFWEIPCLSVAGFADQWQLWRPGVWP